MICDRRTCTSCGRRQRARYYSCRTAKMRVVEMAKLGWHRLLHRSSANCKQVRTYDRRSLTYRPRSTSTEAARRIGVASGFQRNLVRMIECRCLLCDKTSTNCCKLLQPASSPRVDYSVIFTRWRPFVLPPSKTCFR